MKLKKALIVVIMVSGSYAHAESFKNIDTCAFVSSQMKKAQNQTEEAYSSGRIDKDTYDQILAMQAQTTLKGCMRSQYEKSDVCDEYRDRLEEAKFELEEAVVDQKTRDIIYNSIQRAEVQTEVFCNGFLKSKL